MRQKTIANTIKAKGVGLHTGHEMTLTLRPAPENTGVVFRRVDLDPVVEFIVSPLLVRETMLCTTMVKDVDGTQVKIATIEHLMSALAGTGIDNVFIDITADEVPIMDGSSSPFIFLLQSAGVKIQRLPKKFIRILKPISVTNDNGGVASLKPYEGFRLTFCIDFDHPAFDNTAKKMTLEFSSTSYFKEVSRSRTFGFADDMEKLRANNLGLGASLHNAIGLDENGVINQDGLRNKDEFVRHKILDAVGDLFMAGHALVGDFMAHKSGHALNNQLLRALMEDDSAYEIIDYKGQDAPIKYENVPSINS
jgi:UDP-3-O-[3-hydroxymyristoyl] N-acetylglucosamine deacetylase